MMISVASGKGGTGKTSIAINLALSLGDVKLLDCDVEEPNVHILLKPEIRKREPVYSLIPTVDRSLCDSCGECARVCEFNAIFVASEKILVFPERALLDHFNVTPFVCINMYDINVENVTKILNYCKEASVEVVGLIPFSTEVTEAMVVGKTIVELLPESCVAQEIESMWKKIMRFLGEGSP